MATADFALSELDNLIASNTPKNSSPESVYYHNLALQVLHNLQYQQRWTNLQIHTASPITQKPLVRPIVSGLPPRRLYIHPDEQIDMLKAGQVTVTAQPEPEWVLPTHLREGWSLKRFAEIFDAIGIVPPAEDVKSKQNQWRTTKRVLLATLQDDSTVVYYIVHDGIVKPRQN
jgi:tRNA-splicing endonuclease subunit Sen15